MNPLAIRIGVAIAAAGLSALTIYTRKKEKEIEAKKQADIEASKEDKNKVALPDKEELEKKRVKDEPSAPIDNRPDNVGEVSTGETTGE